jgi:GNAT superfamily N-acetyltransferase
MSDEESLQRLFYQLSNESVYRRFLAYRRVHPHADMQHLVDTDDESSMGLVALEKEDGGDIIAMSRYDVEAGTRMAEIACVVRDDWQRRGLGTLLLRRTSEIARARGLAGFRAMVLGSNTPMLTIFHRSGFELHSRVESGVCHLEMLFPEKTPAAARADAATS